MAAHTHIQERLSVLRARRLAGTGYKDLIEAARGTTRVLSNDASAVTSNGAGLDVDVYEIDMTTADVLIGGTFGALPALNDEDILLHANACKLDGNVVEAVADNGDTLMVVCLAILVDGAPAHAFVFGDAAADGNEKTPTPAQCREALARAEIEDHVPSGLGIVLGTVKVARAADAVTLTHSNPATNAALKSGRLAAALE